MPGGKKSAAKPAVVAAANPAPAQVAEDGAAPAATPAAPPKRSDDCCVFVGNVAFTTTWQKLKDVMRKAGDVQLVELVVDSSHKPKGSSLVTYSNPEDAKKAVATLNGVQLDGRELMVRPYEKGARPLVIYGNYTRDQLNRVLPKDKQQPVPVAPVQQPQHHHQGQQQQLPPKHHQQQHVAQHQQQHHAAQHHQPMHQHQQQQHHHQQQQHAPLSDRVSLRPGTAGGKPQHEFRVFDGGDFNKRNRDTFGDEAVAYRSNGTGVPDHQQPAVPMQQQQQQQMHHQQQPQHAVGPVNEQRRKLFVSNLPFTCTWKLLKDTFAQVGKVLRADIIMDERGRSRGMGTVVFATMEDAVRAIDEFDGIEMEGRPMGVRLDRDFVGH